MGMYDNRHYYHCTGCHTIVVAPRELQPFEETKCPACKAYMTHIDRGETLRRLEVE